MRAKSIRRRRSRGAVLVEYALLLTAFAIPMIGGITFAGIQLFNEYKLAKAEILKPMP
jgi:Flp pilus assembly pilin Flp